MTLLTVVQNVADVVGLPRPSAVVSSTDQTVRTLLALSNMDGKSLARRGRWQVLTKEATHTTTAVENQGAVSSIIGDDVAWIISATPWNRTQQDSLGGDIGPQQWQARKAQIVAGPYYDFRIRGGNLLLSPVPPAGETIALEYQSTEWCQSSGSVGQTAWAADDDTGILDESLLELGLRWRYLQSRGLDYSEPFREYEYRVHDALSRDVPRQTLHTDSSVTDIRPTVRVPEGSWSL